MGQRKMETVRIKSLFLFNLNLEAGSPRLVWQLCPMKSSEIKLCGNQAPRLSALFSVIEQYIHIESRVKDRKQHKVHTSWLFRIGSPGLPLEANLGTRSRCSTAAALHEGLDAGASSFSWQLVLDRPTVSNSELQF
jgi:hypothetical protein